MASQSSCHQVNTSFSHKLSLTCLFGILFLGNHAAAQEVEETTPSFSLRGFGTLGVAHSSEEKANFKVHDLQGRGAGHDREWSPDVDSRLGVQLSAQLTPKISGVLQLISEQQHDVSYRPVVEWANLKYEFTPDLSIRAGRIVLPGFLVSDSRTVGYAHPWVRPPVEVYGLLPISNRDGIDVSYRLHAGNAAHNFQVAFGEASANIPGGGKATARDAWLIRNTIEYGSATLNMAYSQARFSVEPFNALFDGFRSFARTPGIAGTPAAAKANALISEYDSENRKLSFISIGGSYDPGNWFVMSEWGQTKSNSAFGKRQAWYATAGYRWKDFTPYLSYAEAKLKSKQRDSGITAAPPIPPIEEAAAALNAGLNEVLSGAPIQKTVSLGVRWDFSRKAAFKLQYDHSRIGNGSPGILKPEAGFERGGSFNVFSAVLDFVF